MHKRLIPWAENLNKFTIENVMQLHKKKKKIRVPYVHLWKKINVFKMNHNILHIIKHAARE